jgi:hypothetical protein
MSLTLFSDIPAGDGKKDKFFYSVIPEQGVVRVEAYCSKSPELSPYSAGNCLRTNTFYYILTVLMCNAAHHFTFRVHYFVLFP